MERRDVLAMLYRILADILVVLHLAFVGFVVLGGLLVLRTPRWGWVHLPVAAWGAGNWPIAGERQLLESGQSSRPANPADRLIPEKKARVEGGHMEKDGQGIRRARLPFVSFPEMAVDELDPVGPHSLGL